MTTDNIEVYVNDRELTIYRGMKIKHALIAYDQGMYKAALNGEVRVEDANGFTIDLEGSLSNGTRIYVSDSQLSTRNS